MQFINKLYYLQEADSYRSLKARKELHAGNSCGIMTSEEVKVTGENEVLTERREKGLRCNTRNLCLANMNADLPCACQSPS